MTIAEIEKLIGIFQDSDLTDLKIADGDHSIRLSRRPASGRIAAGGKREGCGSLRGGSEKGTWDTDTEQSSQETADTLDYAQDQKLTLLKAPLTGVFHLKAQGESEPYCREGTHVKKGDTVGLIEAMKMMSEIKAPVSGLVTKIEAKDSDFCEYGKVLMKIEEDEG